MRDEDNRAAIASIVIGVLLAVAGGGLKMTGYVNPDLGWVMVTIGVGGAVWVAVRTWLPDFLPLPWPQNRRSTPSPGGFPDIRVDQQDELVPWREGTALLDRFDDLAVNPTSKFDGSYRPDSAWDEKYRRFETSLSDLEAAAQQASVPYYDVYRQVCQKIREVLSQPPSSGSVGKAQFLQLRRSGVVKELQKIVHEDRLRFSGEQWSSKDLNWSKQVVGMPLAAPGDTPRCRLQVDLIPQRRFDGPHVLRVGFNLKPERPTAQFLEKPNGPVHQIAPESLVLGGKVEAIGNYVYVWFRGHILEPPGRVTVTVWANGEPRVNLVERLVG